MPERGNPSSVEWVVRMADGLTTTEAEALPWRLLALREGLCPRDETTLRLEDVIGDRRRIAFGRCSACRTLWHLGQTSIGCAQVTAMWDEGPEAKGAMWWDLAPIRQALAEIRGADA